MSRRRLLTAVARRQSNGGGSGFQLDDDGFLEFESQNRFLSGVEYADLVMRDKVMRNRHVLLALNAMLGLALGLITLQVSWDGNELVITHQTRVIRWLVSLLTILLMCQLLDYYRLVLQHLSHDWLTKKSISNYRVTPMLVLRSSNVGPLFWLEALLLVVHPLPFIYTGTPDGTPTFWSDDKWTLLMLGRLYVLGRVVRDYSTIYMKRHSIARCYGGIAPPKFNWLLSFKMYFYQSPMLVMLVLTLLNILICGHVIYIFEREAQVDFHNYWLSLYLAFISMFTGWPTDTYDEHNPATFFGRTACIVACINGVFLLACIVELLSFRLFPNAHQKPALHWVALYKVKKHQRKAAAKLIQVVWRHHRANKNNGKTMLPMSRFKIMKRISLDDQEQERDFTLRYMELSRAFRRLRRERTSLEAKIEESVPDTKPIKEMETILNTQQSKIDAVLNQTGAVDSKMERRIREIEQTQALIMQKIDLLLRTMDGGEGRSGVSMAGSISASPPTSRQVKFEIAPSIVPVPSESSINIDKTE